MLYKYQLKIHLVIKHFEISREKLKLAATFNFLFRYFLLEKNG